MREKTIKIGERLAERADQLRAEFSAPEQQWTGSREQIAYFVLRTIARIIAEVLDSKAPGGEDSGVALRSTDERLAAVLEPVDWPCCLEDLRPGPAIIVATPRDQGRLIFKTEYTENEKIVAYNEAGEFLSLHKGTIVQAVYLTWRER